MINLPVFVDSDSEMDVRERLVTPLFEALGYLPEEVSRERKLTLGSGTLVSTDYVIETDSENEFNIPSNRLVIEAKRPAVPLTFEVLDQAVSYASHRLIEACHIVLTNGIRLQVFEYVSGSPRAILDILVKDVATNWEHLENLIGATKIRMFFAGNDMLEEIGSGGFGRVFKAKHRQLGRTEALKILHPSIESRSSLTMRFNRGAKGLARLRHPQICEVYEVGVYRGRPYYRMEYVEGIELVEFLSSASLELDERINLFMKICDGIDHAHANETFHCDLKPANILVTQAGSPKIIDFDLCHIGDNASTLVTQIGATIAYMDRTIWSNPENRDALADIYSLGLVFWSMVTGRTLAPDWTPDQLRLGLIEANAEWLGQIIFRCVYLDRQHRPQNILALKGLFKVADWHAPVEGLLTAAAGPLSPRDPKTAYELQFQLWKQNRGLPSNNDFDFIRMGIADNPASGDEREFIFRCACAHWRRPLRTIFKDWPTRDLIAAAVKVVEDRTLDPSEMGAVAQSHPARKALDILAVTDEYRSKTDSEAVARFYLDILKSGQLKRMFHNILDDLARLQCFKQGKSDLRVEASAAMIGLVRARLPKFDTGRKKEIGKLLEKLAPAKCGNDSQAVAELAREVARNDALYRNAVPLLAVMNSPHATDALIDILEEAKGSNQPKFEWILPWAVGIKGVKVRQSVVEYLTELSPEYDSDALKVVLSEAARRTAD